MVIESHAFQELNTRFKSMFKFSEVNNIHDNEESDSCDENIGVYTAGIVTHGVTGKISVETAEEESIDLDALQSGIRNNNLVVFDDEIDLMSTKFNIKMNICIIIVGTRGDVQPFIAIAKRLQSHGHRVRLATHGPYRDFVTNHGIEFYPLGGDPKELSAYMVKTGGHLIPLKLENFKNDIPRNMKMIEEILQSTWPAVSAPDPDGNGAGIPGMPFTAHAIISNPVTYGHIHVAERLGVPLHIMFPQPWVPTVSFPHPLANMPYDGKPSKKNYLSYKLVDLLMWQCTEGMVNRFRTETLGLRKIRKGDGGREILLDLRIPHSFMWSPALVSKPSDWGPMYDILGTVRLENCGSSYEPAPDLESFLNVNEGPIFVGFGSMILSNPVETTKMIIRAAQSTNSRVLLQSSWSDMSGNIDAPSNIFFIGNCPHDWLLPRVRAVIHHGGAGTTAAGLLAGKPTFIVSFFGDQPFWGRAVVEAGVGIEPCSIQDLTEDRLADAFTKLCDSDLAGRAKELGDKMMNEDGVAAAIQSFYRHLPLKSMKCDLNHDEIACRWSVSDRLKMCKSCDEIISARPENQNKKVIDYRAVDYSARGPEGGLWGASSGACVFLHEISGAMKDVVLKPARGYKAEGTKGAVLGVIKGLSGLIIRPIHGVALFADRVAAGHYNYYRQEGQRKRQSLLEDHIATTIGCENNIVEAYSSSMKPEEISNIFSTRQERTVVYVSFTKEEKLEYQNRFREVITLREEHEAETFSIDQSVVKENSYQQADSIEIEEEDIEFTNRQTLVIHSSYFDLPQQYPTAQLRDFEGSDVPAMNICLLTVGSWEDEVKHFVAVGERLKGDGHRVRMATNESHRELVKKSNLEFYPLDCQTEDLYELVEKLLSKTNIETIMERNEYKKLIFSMWPAVVASDPHAHGRDVPGEPFHADAIICHPLLIGNVHIAQSLGIPLHCMSVQPLFLPNMFSMISNAEKGSNFNSCAVVETMLGEVLETSINQFRFFIGLHDTWKEGSLLSEWKISCSYLLNPNLFQNPSMWGSEVYITGYVGLEVDKQYSTWEDICLLGDLPAIFLRTQLEHVEKLADAAKMAGIQILLQLVDDGSASLIRNNHIYQVPRNYPHNLILHHANAVIHSGQISLIFEGLAAGKPQCIYSNSQVSSMWSNILVDAGVGHPEIELNTCSIDDLADMFERVLKSGGLQEEANKVAASFDDKQAVNDVVEGFYSNLPLPSMVCDLNRKKIARIYYPKAAMKLSYEAHCAVHNMAGDISVEVLKYQPLLYKQGCVPKYFLRGVRGEFRPDEEPHRLVMRRNSISDVFASWVEPIQYQKRDFRVRHVMQPAIVLEKPYVWKNQEEEVKERMRTNRVYESIMSTPKIHALIDKIVAA